MKLTTARFFSPKGLPYSGRGVVPDLAVEQEGEPAFNAARQEVRRLASMMMVR